MSRAQPPGHDDVRDVHLPSGLRAVVQAVPGAPVVALQVWVGVGSFHEQPGQHGLAHLHEHMLFKGTARRGVGEIAASVERAGGQINAWTNTDHTCFHVVMPTSSWREGLDTLADAVCHSVFDTDELTREIDVVVEEIHRANDSPGQVAWRRLFACAYGEHPYGRPVLGTENSVRSMTREAMRRFYRQHYVASNLTVTAAGDLNVDETLAAIANAFADLPAQPPQPTPKQEPGKPGAGYHYERTAFSESRLILAWPIPQLDHRDVPALDVLAIVLGQGDSSRLVQRVQRKSGLVNDIGASSWTPLRGGLFSVTALTSAERLAEARQAIIHEIQNLRSNGVDSGELDKARHNVLADAVYKQETVQGLAHSLGYFATATGDPHWDRHYVHAVSQLRPADVQRVARRYLAPETLSWVELPGEDGAAEVDAPATWLNLQQQLRLGPTHRERRERDLVDGLERLVLPTGDILIVQHDRSVPLIGLRVAAHGGLRDENPDVNGRAYLCGQMLTRGTATRSSGDIAKEVETLAAGLAGFAGRNSLGLMATGLASGRDRLLDVFFDCLFASELPSGDLEQERAVQLEDLRHQRDAPARQTLRLLATTLYGQHPYSLDLLGNIPAVGRLQSADLRTYLRRRLTPGRLVYAASGDIDADELAATIVAQSPAAAPAEPPPPSQPVARPREPIQVRSRTDKQQAHLALGFVGARLDDPARYALDILATVLSGQSGRLFIELRDRQSLGYAVSAMHVEGLDEGYFAVYLGTGADKIDQGLAGLYHQLDRLRQNPIGPEELHRARQSMVGAFAIGLQRRSSRAATLCLNELYGLGRLAYRGQIEALLAVTAADVQAAAQHFLDPQHCVEVILAPNAS